MKFGDQAVHVCFISICSVFHHGNDFKANILMGILKLLRDERFMECVFVWILQMYLVQIERIRKYIALRAWLESRLLLL